MTWKAPEVDRPEGPLTGPERPMLQAFLDWQRATLLYKCGGLSGEQLAERAVPPSGLSLLGLIRHMTKVERAWFRVRFAGEPVELPFGADSDAEFEGVDPARAAADYARLTEEFKLADAAAANASLDDTFIHRNEVMSLRMIYLHMIEEYARHLGHADLLRERIDGAIGELPGDGRKHHGSFGTIDGVKIFISFDMEGVAGIADWSQCRGPGQAYEEGRRLLLGEVNAAIDGALAGGATEIVCNDSHGTMFNLDPAALHGQAGYVSGRHKPLYMMQGLDAGADMVFMVGYHGSISGESSVLSHTYNPSVVSHVELNGVRVGESGINALVALAWQVPVGLITGDRQTIGEADPFLPDCERVVVKDSFTRFGAAHLHPEAARAKIAEGARRAAERAGGMKPPAISLPATLEVHMQTADMAEVASWVRGVERTGVRTVSIHGEDPLAMFRSFVGITYITRVSEGRLRR